MNFTSQRFSSPSICEYPTLEGDLSSSKKQPEAKPIVGVKRSLSSLQKAQDQEKWPRNYEVMIQSPKPVNPVLHLPQFEANRFNQLQTRHWRPGDHFNQSGDILVVQEDFCKFIPCTSNHWIRRILIYSNLPPYLEQTDINVQQLFSLQIRHEIRTYIAPRKVPRKLSYPLKPSRFRPEVCLARGVLKRLLFQRFFIISPLFGEVFALSGLSPVSWFRTDAPRSWEILWLVLSRGCAWGAFFLGVVIRGWRFLWQRVSSHQTAYASLSVYLSLGFGFLTVATRSSLSSPIIIVILWR
ncbi:hypothetical protein YC2023_075110 [Brassica napus]